MSEPIISITTAEVIELKRVFALLLLLSFLLPGCQKQVVHSPSTAPAATETVFPETTQEATVSPTTVQATVPEATAAATTATTVPEVPLAEPVFDAIAFTNSLTTEEKVGQLFLARCPDVNALEDIQSYHLGGYILFDRDFRDSTPDSIRAMITEFQQRASIPLLIAVDEEGGNVTRVSCYSQYRDSNFPSPRDLYDQGGMALIEETEREKCRLLQSLGINVNMAPVCDITTDPAAFMYSRSLGQSTGETAHFVRTLVDIMQAHQIGSVLKHFPGYGNNVDTHTGIAIDERTLDELETVDLIPFAAGINAGCGAVLISHTFVNALDTQYPASLSAPAHQYLRGEMGFEGVIITDDLVMQAITDLYGAEEAAVLAVLAGNDLLCSSEYQIQYAAVLDAVQSGRIPEELLNQAVARNLQWKYELGLIT